MKKIILSGIIACLLIAGSSCNGSDNKPADPTTNRTTPTVENTPSTPDVSTADSLHKADSIKNKKDEK